MPKNPKMKITAIGWSFFKSKIANERVNIIAVLISTTDFRKVDAKAESMRATVTGLM